MTKIVPEAGSDRTRRGVLRGLGIAGLAAMAAPTVRPALAAATSFEDARHLLARTGFSVPLPEEVAAASRLGWGESVDRLLADWRTTAATPAPSWVGESAAELRRAAQEFREERAQARAATPPGTAAAPQPGKNGGRVGIDGKPLARANPLQEQVRELRNWWLEEMLATSQPFVERMVLFWHNHFTSGFQKVRLVPALYRQNLLFREHALGNFGTLLRAIARDPAMLIWLDGVQNRVGQPNENFARELLELFTLGEGRYGEDDVRAAARAFTGWSIDRESGAYRFYPALHDSAEKAFLGRRGKLDGDDIVSILLEQPRTAELIVEKLWREFVSFTPDPAEVKRLAGLFRNANYELRPLLRALFASERFRAAATRGGLIKSPVELIVGTVRLLGLPVPEKTRLARGLQVLGQILFDPPNVKGWPGGTAWVSTNTLLLRQQILRRIIEATTVAPMDGAMRSGRRAERTEQMMEPRPVEGRSLRNADSAVRLGPTLAGVDTSTLVRTLVALRPLTAIDPAAEPGAVVADLLLDPTYQLK